MTANLYYRRLKNDHRVAHSLNKGLPGCNAHNQCTAKDLSCAVVSTKSILPPFHGVYWRIDAWVLKFEAR